MVGSLSCECQGSSAAAPESRDCVRVTAGALRKTLPNGEEVIAAWQQTSAQPEDDAEDELVLPQPETQQPAFADTQQPQAQPDTQQPVFAETQQPAFADTQQPQAQPETQQPVLQFQTQLPEALRSSQDASPAPASPGPSAEHHSAQQGSVPRQRTRFSSEPALGVPVVAQGMPVAAHSNGTPAPAHSNGTPAPGSSSGTPGPTPGMALRAGGLRELMLTRFGTSSKAPPQQPPSRCVPCSCVSL